MHPDDLANLLDPRKFKPFAINLSNGESYQILHPEQMVVGRSTVAIGTRRRNGHKWFERIITCGLIHIVSLVPIEEASVE